jgi:multidrug efflux pump subunit AcrA (membrane-fusion protein)
MAQIHIQARRLSDAAIQDSCCLAVADLRKDDAALFPIQRTDRMRVVLSLPERDVPLVDPGDPAEVEIDALPGKKWSAKVARIAGSLDFRSRTMRVEIDLPNPTGQLLPGMYGRVTIDVQKRK